MIDEDETDGPCFLSEPIGLADADIAIIDPVEFGYLTNSIAAMNVDGALFVLDRESMKWRNVTELGKGGTPKAKLTSVQ